MVGLRMDINRAWDRKSSEMLAMALEFPIEMAVFYESMASMGKKMVQDELMARVYNAPLPTSARWGNDPSPRTGQTLLAVKGSSSGLRASVFIDRRMFRYFYPYILEVGRAGTAYFGRRYFQTAMRKLEVIYFRQGRVFLRQILGRRGLL